MSRISHFSYIARCQTSEEMAAEKGSCPCTSLRDGRRERCRLGPAADEQRNTGDPEFKGMVMKMQNNFITVASADVS